jgi:6-phosphogluconolactonase (cycloisomerase 2 family)
MRKRFTWIAGILVLVSISALVACSAKFDSSNNGLVVVASQGDLVMQTFSLDIGNGHLTQINNVNGPPTNGVPTSVVLDPGGPYAYLLLTASTPTVPNSGPGIAPYSIASDGKLALLGPTVTLTPGAVPVALTIDSAGKFLFVAANTPGSAGEIAVFSIGSSGALTEVPGSPFLLPTPLGGRVPQVSALAITPTVFPPAFAACSGSAPPTTENLYVTDSVNYFVLNYLVGSSGALTIKQPTTALVGIATGTVPSGVTVDPCNRFVYVSNGQPNNTVSGYTVCNNLSLPLCPEADFSLHPIAGSPFAAGNAPGPLTEDAFAKYLYVINVQGNSISPFAINTSSGVLTPLTPAPIATNIGPTAISVRGDDTWLFVSNITSANISEYAITTSTGQLTPQPTIDAFPLPYGIAVK